MAYDFNSLTKQADEASNRNGFYTDFEDVDQNKLHQISELTDWMRTKAKGSDVREIIAQLFERTWLENIKEGNANMEVSLARGSYPNLKSRLDEADNKQRKTTAQLAEKANKDEVTNVMTPKGTLAYASLPTSGNQVGWYYYCPDGDGTHGAGNYVWNGTSWYFGGTGDEGYNLLKEDLDDLEDSFIINLADDSKFTNGYCSNSGQIVTPSGDYFFTERIPVMAGETIYFNGDKIRFLTAYKNGVVSESDGLGVSEEHKYVVPDGVTEIVITSNPVWLNNTKNLMVSRTKYDYLPFGERILMADKIEKIVNPVSNTVTKNSLESGVNIECETNNIVKNKKITFSADLTTFDSVVVGHGFLSYDGSSVNITSTNVEVYAYTPTSQLLSTTPHGLTIEDNICVSITVNAQRKASLLLTSKSGGFVIHDIPWGGCSGKPFARPRNCTLTNVKLSFSCNDYGKDIWAFGDSYMTTTAPTRYPYYLYNLGIDNYLLDAFGGRNSVQAFDSFSNALKYGTPKYLLWFLGMNDPDTNSTSNADWYNIYNKVINICKAKDITPIFARTPCTPTNNNWYKNRVIEHSGYRFVNFAKAVGANDVGSSWYNGLLSNDKLHPTEEGAKVLANQLLADVPELTI